MPYLPLVRVTVAKWRSRKAKLWQTRHPVKGLATTKRDKGYKFLPGAELFHVKLRDAIRAAGLGPSEVARIMKVDASTVHRWYKGKMARTGTSPDGLRMCILLTVLGLCPEHFLDALPESPGKAPARPQRGDLATGAMEERVRALEAAVRRIEASLVRKQIGPGDHRPPAEPGHAAGAT